MESHDHKEEDFVSEEKDERNFEAVIRSTFCKKDGYKMHLAKIVIWYQNEYYLSFDLKKEVIIYGIERNTKPKTFVIYAGFAFLPFKEFVELVESMGWKWIRGNFEDIIRNIKNTTNRVL